MSRRFVLIAPFLVSLMALSTILVSSSKNPKAQETQERRKDVASSGNGSTVEGVRLAELQEPAIRGKTGDSDTKTPLTVHLSMNRLPKAGESTEVTCTVTSSANAPEVFASIHLPDDAALINGTLDWKGPLYAGQSVSFSGIIAFQSNGRKIIRAQAKFIIDSENSWGDSDTIYLNVGALRTLEGFHTPEEKVEMNATDASPSRASGVQQDALPASVPEYVDKKSGPPALVAAGRPHGIASSPTVILDGALTVTGKWSHYDRNGSLTPSRNFLVELRRASDGTHLAFAYTDNSGNFSLGPVTNPSSDGVKVRVWTYVKYESPDPSGDELMVIPNGQTSDYTNSYYSEIKNTYVFPDGSNSVGSWEITRDSPEGTQPNAHAWYLKDDIDRGWRYPSTSVGDCTVEWQFDSTVGTFYRPGEHVHLLGNDRKTSDVIIHEMGHNVMYNVYGGAIPTNDCPDPHYIMRSSGIFCAWSEGWANFYALAVNNDPVFNWPDASLNLETPTWGTPNWDDGATVEGRVAGAMWDIFDSSDDGFDHLSDGFSDIWSTFSTHTDVTFRHYWNDLSTSGINTASGVDAIYQNTIDYRSNCTYSLNPTSQTFIASASTGSFSVFTAVNCSWTATTNVNWLSTTSTGSANGTVSYSVAANTGDPRTGSITVGDQTFTVFQSGGNGNGCPSTTIAIGQTINTTLTTSCVLTGTLRYVKFYDFSGNAGQQIVITMSSTAFDTYLFLDSPDHRTIAQDDNGGGGTNSRIPANSGSLILPTTGTYIISATSFSPDGTTGSTGPYTISLSNGTPCSYSISPSSQSVGAGTGSNSFSISAPAGCTWTALSNASWITTSSSGSGNGTINYSVAANNGAARTGTISVGGQLFTVTQAGTSCTYSISPTSQGFSASGGSSSVGVTTSAACAWSAASNSSFITITSGSNGSGNGAVNYSVAANSGTAQRTGTMTIAGQTFTVSQAGTSCSYSISPTTQSFSTSGGSNSVSVTAGAGCAWSAVSSSSFITITSGSSGSGNGTVTYSVTANSAAGQRTGTMTIAGTTFTVTQAGTTPPTNYALGGVATASSTYNSLYPASAVNNGDRRGLNWGNGGGWNDGTAGAYPDWVEIDFNGAKPISEIDVFTLQDNVQNFDPTETMTFSQYGITVFDVQYWDGSVWVTVPGGSVSGNNKVWRKFSFPEVQTSRVRVLVNNSLAGYTRVTELEAWGQPTGPVNLALASNGAIATASSIFNSSYPASAVNNGDRKGLNWGSGGGWNDGTPGTYPDWVQIDFNGLKTIGEIDVFTLQDNVQNLDPTEAMTFSQYGITAFDVQYWDGSSWITVPGGSVTGNNKVWRKFTFATIQTIRIRVLVNNALANYSRIVEVEAYADQTTEPPPPNTETNFALPLYGGVASASSTFSASYAASAVNNGDRKGSIWGNGGGWNDATANTYPDWVQIDFNGPKTINEIDVFTIQDNYLNPIEPTDLAMTFSQYGITAFDVQYWDGASWVTVPGGSVTGNNKVWRQIKFSNVQTTRVRVLVNNALNGYSRIAEVEAWGLPPNVAAAINGGVATASSTFSSSYPASSVINGDRKGLNWGNGGGWNDATPNSYPDWVQVDFNGVKAINEIDVFTLQDNAQNLDPTETMTFSQYGITAFDVQYWDGASWITVAGGTVNGNNKVWRKFTFPSIQTSRIRVLVNNANGYSRIVEVEAY